MNAPRGGTVDRVDVVVIGAGQAGLAAGFFLGRLGCRFAILDAASQIGHSWRTRYDSLLLFTPGRYNALPGLPFPGDPDRYPTKDDVADYLEGYAAAFDLPVRLNTRVRAVHRPSATGPFLVLADAGTWITDQVIVASGPFQRPFIPPVAAGLAPAIAQVHSSDYRNPAQLPPGEVLVVGAGNSGAQIAEELSATREVTLAVGRRAPMLPQRFLGRDLFWWLHRLGVMGVTADSPLGRRLRRADPLIGTNLRHLARAGGVRLAGRAVGAEGDTVTFSDGQSARPQAVVWATGYRPDYRWIDLPILDADGAAIHRRGITAVPGLSFLGLPWLNRRGSALLGGVGDDAAFLAAQVAARLHVTGVPQDAAHTER